MDRSAQAQLSAREPSERPSMATIETSDERALRRGAMLRSAVFADRGVRWAAAAAALWVLLYGVANRLSAGHAAAHQALGDLVYLVPIACAAVLSVRAARVNTGRARRLWRVLAVSNVLWLAGDLLWAIYAYVLHEEAPFPSVADVLYLASYAAVPVALVVQFGDASRQRRLRGLIDGLIIITGLGALGWRLLIAPQVGGGMSLATATAIAYPLLGLIILILLLSVVIGGRRNLPVTVWLVVTAFTVSALTDAGYTYLASLHSYVSGDWLNLGWQFEAVVMSLAAYCAVRHAEAESTLRSVGRDVALVPTMVGVGAAFALLSIDAAHHGVGVGTVLVLAAVVAALVVRFMLSVADTRRAARELDASLNEQQRLAISDGLTGLYNRRFFEEMLRLESDRAKRAGNPLALMVVDLDHFKRVNDEHGHQSGDTVLKQAAARLRSAMRSSDIVARYGGEEFVVILPEADTEVALELAERCRIALQHPPVTVDAGRAVVTTGSFGVASMPADAQDTDALIRCADRALYRAKETGRNRVCLAADNDKANPSTTSATPPELALLQRIADAVDARLSTAEHSAAMARWAGVLADALALDEARRRATVAAARLHDVGKILLPEGILTKQGPLTDAEWALLRTHSEHGQRLINEVPGYEDVALIVRAHHERVDGSGYPDRLNGSALPLEARIIAVCDTWAAMRVDRPYARARTVEQTRAELLRVSGTQLDPAVVEAFLALQSTGLVGTVNERVLPADSAQPARMRSASVTAAR